MFKGPKASDNPWEATTLEWTTATPRPHDNFGGRTPVVNNGPCEYSVPGAPRESVMQSDPPTAAAHSALRLGSRETKRAGKESFRPPVPAPRPPTSPGDHGPLPAGP